MRSGDDDISELLLLLLLFDNGDDVIVAVDDVDVVVVEDGDGDGDGDGIDKIGDDRVLARNALPVLELSDDEFALVDDAAASTTKTIRFKFSFSGFLLGDALTRCQLDPRLDLIDKDRK